MKPTQFFSQIVLKTSQKKKKELKSRKRYSYSRGLIVGHFGNTLRQSKAASVM